MSESPYDLWSPQARANPLPIYARMREEAPIARLIDPLRKVPIWVVSRYRDAVEALRAPRLSKDFRNISPEYQAHFLDEAGAGPLRRHMLAVDPPDHTRLRALVSKAFNPRRVDALRPRITVLASELLESARSRGSVDLIDAFAFPLPIAVISELLGVPLEDRERFRQWTQALITPPAENPRESLRSSMMAFGQYIQELCEKRRGAPGDDLLSALLAAEEQGDRLTPQELIGMVFLLLVAGHETTVNLIGNGTLALLRHPEQLERVRQDRSLIESAVEEMLRYDSPVETSTLRFTLEDTELAGQKIPAGELILAGILSANHDPEQFPDPERFDVGRTPNKHIAFGFGIHFCLGAPLARLEAAIAFDLLLDRAPGLKLEVPPEHLRWRNSILIHGLEQLPVSF